MALTNLLPRTVSITGTSCSGTDGNSNRTYTLPDSGILSSGMKLVVSGTSLHRGTGLDYTIVGSTITFLNALFDTDVIECDYFITFGSPAAASLSTSTSLKYATPFMLGEVLGIVKDIPSWTAGGTPTLEAVGTGNGVNSVFYLDQKSVVSDSYTLYANGVVMTDVTHYNVNEDIGKIVLTAAGIALLASTALTAEYKYYDNGMTDSYLVSVLSRAEKEVDNSINSTFTDGTATNPVYPVEEETHPTEGSSMDRWFTKKRPLIDIESALDGDVAIGAATLDLTSDAGGELFPSSGYIIIGSEIMTYTGVSGDTLTGLSRGVLGTTAATHSDGDAVHTTIVLISDTDEGTEEAWTVQPWGTNVDVTNEGLIYRYLDASPDVLTRAGVAKRFKIIYYHGFDTVPEDITRLTIALAKRMLINDNVGKSIIAGRNEFRPEMVNVDETEINRIIDSYITLPMGNT